MQPWFFLYYTVAKERVIIMKDHVCVFGASSSFISGEYIRQTELLGEKLAQAGFKMVYGGGCQGLMGAAARGMKRADGYIISISPKIFNQAGVLFADFNELYLTDDLIQRKKIMLELSDFFIAVPGGIGTFDELFEVYAQSQLGYYRKPLILYNINGYYDKLWEFINHSYREGFCSDVSLSLCFVSSDADEIVRYLRERSI